MRDYLPGDDIRSIDWKATARTGSPHVRVFTEERDRPALLVIDQRMSMFFGSRLNMKSVTAAEAASIAAFGILNAGDRVGGIVFGDDDLREVTPRRSRRATYALLEAIAEMNRALHADRAVQPRDGALNDVLQRVARLAHHDHLVLVFSDFDGINATTERHLGGIAAHNDVILVLVHDPLALDMSLGARVVVGDSRMQAELDLESGPMHEAVAGFTRARLERIRGWQQRINLSVLPLSAGEETLPQIRRLLGQVAAQRKLR